MKITDVQLIYAKHYLFVHVHTDAGIVGLGEAGNWGYLDATAACIRIVYPPTSSAKTPSELRT